MMGGDGNDLKDPSVSGFFRISRQAIGDNGMKMQIVKIGLETDNESVRRIGVAGASTTGTLALTAAAMFPDITLTIEICRNARFAISIPTLALRRRRCMVNSRKLFDDSDSSSD